MILRAATLFLAMMLGLAALPDTASAQGTERPLRVMTFNVRLPLARDGVNRWAERRALVLQTIAAARPDLIGTQELYKVQGDFIVDQLPQYAWFGTDRRGGHGDEHVGIIYDRGRLQVIESGDFWLSDTPNLPGSISWNNLFPRIVTWAVVETRDTKRRFAVFNTHFPYRAEDEPARLRAAELLASRMAALAPDLPVVLMGDFNTEPDGPVYQRLTERLIDVRVAAPDVSGPEGTFHGFTGVAKRRIDWILTRGFKPLRSKTLTHEAGAPYPSDHFPVTAELGW
jgi:endonuclease/exonuclease/phosphatase family metal-dependent hydrolase